MVAKRGLQAAAGAKADSVDGGKKYGGVAPRRDSYWATKCTEREEGEFTTFWGGDSKEGGKRGCVAISIHLFHLLNQSNLIEEKSEDPSQAQRTSIPGQDSCSPAFCCSKRLLKRSAPPIRVLGFLEAV